jgi:hypothetical protein
VEEHATHQIDVEIPYVEIDKCVRVSLVSLPPEQDALVMLIQLSFYDLYDDLHRHTYGSKGTNALHGRLVWLNVQGETESTPEGRSRGEGVDYNIGGIE